MAKLFPVSINNLPPELLTNIFRFVHGGSHCLVVNEPGNRDITEDSLGYPGQPHTVSHVCSTWRRIVLAMPSLWSHIDIAIDHELNHRLFSRAKLHAQRAGQHPLEIHLLDPGSAREEQRWTERWHRPHLNPSAYEDLYEYEFLDASAAPINSLVFEFYVFEEFRLVHFAALGYFLSKCAAGVLAQYTTRIDGDQPIMFIETSQNPWGQPTTLNIPGPELEDVWHSVRIAHLSGLGPRWESKLYHGLVDLRLEAEVPNMTGSQIVSILNASPGLRILHLRVKIHFQAEGTTLTPAHVHLNDLEILNLAYNNELVHYIRPGIKPLQFTFFGRPMEETIKFFERSNLTKLYLREWEPFPLVSLLGKIPQLQTLILDSDGVASIESAIDPVGDKGSLAYSCPTRIVPVDTLYLISFDRLKLSDIQQLVDMYSVRRLFLRDCYLVHRNPTNNKETIYKDEINIRPKLTEIKNCPMIELPANDVDPADWE